MEVVSNVVSRFMCEQTGDVFVNVRSNNEKTNHNRYLPGDDGAEPSPEGDTSRDVIRLTLSS